MSATMNYRRGKTGIATIVFCNILLPMETIKNPPVKRSGGLSYSSIQHHQNLQYIFSEFTSKANSYIDSNVNSINFSTAGDCHFFALTSKYE